jgi:hypothetical protein
MQPGCVNVPFSEYSRANCESQFPPWLRRVSLARIPNCREIKQMSGVSSRTSYRVKPASICCASPKLRPSGLRSCIEPLASREPPSRCFETLQHSGRCELMLFLCFYLWLIRQLLIDLGSNGSRSVPPHLLMTATAQNRAPRNCVLVA